MLSDDLRTVLDGTPIAHLATTLPDGSPHSVRCGSAPSATGSRS
jgi:hypothetical protein